MKKFSALLIILLVSVAALSAQDNDKDKFNFGIYLGGNLNMHQPEFQLGDNGYFFQEREFMFDENANSFGFNGGIILNFPITRMFTISGRLGYNMMNGVIEKDYAFMDTSFTGEIDASLSYFEIAPILQIHNLIDGTPLYLLAGLELGLPVSNQYDHSESLVTTPINESFPDGTTKRTYESGADIPDAATRFALAVGAGYTFDLSDNVHLAPEVSFRYPFTKVSSGDMFDSWTAPQIRLGVNLTFSLGGKKEVAEEKTSYFLEVGFDEVNYFDDARQARKLDNIRVEEVQYTELFPLVPYVFFDELSDEPTESVHQLTSSSEAGIFKIEELQPSALQINSRNLDIVGTRLQSDKNANITISGTIDDKTEKNKIELAKKRAEFAKNYLIVNYGVEPSRIKTAALENPSKPSSSRVEDGVAENRRVELTSNKAEILKPIVTKAENQRISEPEQIQFVPSVKTNDTIISWELEVMQAGKLLRKFAGKTMPQQEQWSIMPNELAASNVPVDYTLNVRTQHGKEETASGSIPVEYFSYTRKQKEEKKDRTISKYSLILFDFNSPKVSDKDKEIINESILPAISYNSTVQIYGYTDRIGTEDYNQRLALERAENVRKALSQKAPDAKYEVYGVGENVEIYDNDSPIGRQLSRTVQVYVITPKE